jgi:hypothetical protein
MARAGLQAVVGISGPGRAAGLGGAAGLGHVKLDARRGQ